MTKSCSNSSVTIVPELSRYQKAYWAKSGEYREAQRAKYKKYPEKIKAMNKRWQEAHPEYFKALTRLNSSIHYARTTGNVVAEARFECQKKMLRDNYKKGLIN